jgi:hypothetical protein
MNVFGISPEALTGAGVTTLGLALGMLGLFIRGAIVPGKHLDRSEASNAELRLGVKEMAAALDRRNEIDAAVIGDRVRARGRG